MPTTAITYVCLSAYWDLKQEHSHTAAGLPSEHSSVPSAGELPQTLRHSQFILEQALDSHPLFKYLQGRILEVNCHRPDITASFFFL